MWTLLLGEEVIEEDMTSVFKIWSGREDVAAQQLYFQLKSSKAWDESIKESFALRLSCESSWQLLVYFKAYSMQGLSVCSYLLPQRHGQGSCMCALGTPAGIASIGKNTNILIHTNDKPSLLVQMVSTTCIALSISQDLDSKAK